MNKTISLPQIHKKNTQKKNEMTIEINTKQSVSRKEINIKGNQTSLVQNQQQTKIINHKKIRSQSLLNKKNQKQFSSAILQPIKESNQKKYGILANGKIKKVQQSQASSRAITSQRSMSSQLGNNMINKQEKIQISKIKKQLNELTSSGLILKRQIRTIQGHTLQIKQQISTILAELNPKSSKAQHKIIQVEQKMIMVKYDNQILKGMKQRMKKIKLFLQKKILDARQQLDKAQKRAKVLGNRSAIRQQGINKNKYLSKKVTQRQKQKNADVQLQVKQIQRKLKQYNEIKNLNIKNQYKNLTQAEYHYQVYKNQEYKIKSEVLANIMLNKLLNSEWQRYSIKYKDVEKAGKLIEIYSLKNKNQVIKLNDIYFDSFETKKNLQNDIKDKQNRLKDTVKRNAELKIKWDQFKFKQIQEKQKIIDKTELSIKTGKIEVKKVVENKHRQMMQQIKKNMRSFQERTKTISSIKDWIVKIQKTLQLNRESKSNILQVRLLDVINHVRKEYKDLKLKQ